MVGVGGAAGNSLIISNGGKVVADVGQVLIGDSGSTGNVLRVDNGTFSAQSMVVGAGFVVTSSGGASNSVIVTNGG